MKENRGMVQVKIHRRVGKGCRSRNHPIHRNQRQDNQKRLLQQGANRSPRDNQKKEIWMNLQELMPPRARIIINRNNGPIRILEPGLA